MNIMTAFEHFMHLLSAVPVTLGLTIMSLLLGSVLACFIAMARLSKSMVLSQIAYGYVYIIRGTPLLLQLFFIYYGLAQFEAFQDSVVWQFFKNPYGCAILALAMNTGAYSSEIIRAAFQNIPSGQIEAAIACGMNGIKRVRYITGPQALRLMLPAYSNEIVIMVKATSVASVITIVDITGAARLLAAQTYSPIEIFGMAGLIYLSINGALIFFMKKMENKFNMAG